MSDNSPKTKIRVQTKAGIVEPELGPNGWVRVNMGYPKFHPQDIPFLTEELDALYTLPLANEQSLKLMSSIWEIRMR